MGGKKLSQVASPQRVGGCWGGSLSFHLSFLSSLLQDGQLEASVSPRTLPFPLFSVNTLLVTVTFIDAAVQLTHTAAVT